MGMSLEGRCPFHAGGHSTLAAPPISTSAHRTLKDLPGPKGLPFLGNLLQIDLKKFHVGIEEWAKVYGPMYKFKIAGKTVVAVSDPELIHEVSRKRPATYRRLEAIELVLKELGINGVFSAEGEQWHRQRRMTMQALNVAHLQSFFPTLLKMTDRLKRRWESAIRTGRPVEVRTDLMRYTIDVTSNLAFGFDVNTLEETGSEIQRHVEQILPMMNRRINAPFPYWHFFKLPADRALDRALVEIRKAVGEFIAHSRARLIRNPDLAKQPTNFLEAMLAAHDDGDSEFSDNEIFGNILTMLVAGEDTTAYTLAWMIHFLTEHPSIQERMQEEVDQVLGEATMMHEFRDHERLPYVEAVAYETLRMKSVVPVLLLESNTDVQLDGVEIPAGTPVFLLMRHAGLQEHAFAEASQFQPERWLALRGENQVGHSSKAFVPFGAGPRFCPGRNLALLELKAVMTMLCRNFTITKATDAPPVEEQFAVVMMPSKLSINFKLREARYPMKDSTGTYSLAECPYAGIAS